MGKGTKDTNYVMALYDMAKEAGDLFQPLNKYDVGIRAGIKSRAVDAITKLLVQANFIKKVGEDDIILTPHGENLVKRLRNLS
jgi:predicted transcriptional regulator